MNLNNVSSGQIFKNYKELCNVLSIPIKAGNSKTAQLKELQRFCNLNKVGHSFSILEIYDKPLEKIDNRGGNNSVYSDLIQLLILDLLAQCPQGSVSISRSKLLLTINMINSNYSIGNEYIPKLSKYTKIEEATIHDFYNTNNSNFRSTIETSLNKLMDKRIIFQSRIIKVCEKLSNKHRIATQEEKEIILEKEKEVLNLFGFSEITQARSSKYWRLFKKKVKKLLNDNSDIEYYYHAYDITINRKYIEDERKTLSDLLLEDFKRMEYKEELNSTVYYNIIKNAENRHEKGFVSGRMSKVRSDKQYINHIKKLVRLLIDDNASYIIHELKELEIEDTYDLDYLFE